jgi:YDG domain
MIKLPAVLAVGLGLFASSLQAANFIAVGHPAYDPIADATASAGTSYAVGSQLIGQTNAQGLVWVLAGTNVIGPSISATSLSYPGLLASSGGSVSLVPVATGDYARWNFNSTISGSTAQTLYYSMLLDVTNLGTLTTGGVFVACFNNLAAAGGAPTVNLGGRLYLRNNGAGGYNVGVNKEDGSTVSTDIVYAPANLSLNSTHFVVVGYTFSGTPSSANDSVELWLDPATNTFGAASAPTADLTTALGANINTGATENILSLLLRENNVNIPPMLVASVSVGLAWADVTPLPSGSLVPTFSNLVATTNTAYHTSATLTGTLSASGGTVFPAMGDGVTVTVDGTSQGTTINDSTGDFSINFNPGSTPISATPYTVSYSYGGNPAVNLAGATNTATTLAVNSPLIVVLNGTRPVDGTTTILAGSLFVANVVGTDVVSVVSGSGTLAGATAGPQAITSVGTLTLGGAQGTNYTLAGASGTVTLTTPPITAGHPVFDPFNDASASGGSTYANVANLAGQTNAQGRIWFAAGNGAAGQPMIQAGALPYPGLLAVSTNSVSYGGAAGTSARLDLGTSAGSSVMTGSNGLTVYYSMPFVINTPGGLSATPALIAGFNNSAGTQANQPTVYCARLNVRLDGAGYDIGINKADATNGDITWEPGLFNVGTTYFIVAAYKFSGSPGLVSDTASLWVNPSASTFGAASAPTPDITATAGPNLGNTSTSDIIDSFILRESTTVEPAVMTVGQLSVGTTWADVTPPATAATFPITSESISNGNFILTWQSTPGTTYHVVGSPVATTPMHTWTNVTSPIVATGTSTSATNATSGSANFYGVISP